MRTYVDGADEVFVAHQDIGEAEGKDDGENPGADKTLNSLLGTDLDKLGTAKGDATDVGENVIGDDQSGGKEEPDHALKNVVHDKVSLNNNEIEGHVSPGELLELELVVTLLKRDDKEDEASDIEHETDEAMVGSKRQEDSIDQNNMLEVVNDALAVEKIHGGSKEVPV